MHAGRRLRDSTFLSYQSNLSGLLHTAVYKARCVRLGTHDRMAKEARVGRRGLGGVPVMRAARGWASVVDRTAVAAALFGDDSPVRSQRDVGTRDRAVRLGKRCSGSLPIGPVARRDGVGAGYGVLRGGGDPLRVKSLIYGRDLLGRILGSESRSYLGVEIGSRVEIVSRFRCVDFSRFVEVTSCLNSRLIKFGSIVFSHHLHTQHQPVPPTAPNFVAPSIRICRVIKIARAVPGVCHCAPPAPPAPVALNDGRRDASTPLRSS